MLEALPFMAEKLNGLVEVLQKEMANRGFLVFEGQGVLTAQQQIKASELWGGTSLIAIRIRIRMRSRN